MPWLKILSTAIHNIAEKNRLVKHPPEGGSHLSMEHDRRDYQNILMRLNRAHGHFKSIIAMMEDGRGCLELAQQLQAVERAIGNARKAQIHEHIYHCLEHLVQDGAVAAEDAVREFKEITKYV